MFTLILIAHVLLGFITILSAIAPLIGLQRIARLYRQLLFLLVLSGVGLVLNGGSLTHACITGGLTLTFATGLRYFVKSSQAIL